MSYFKSSLWLKTELEAHGMCYLCIFMSNDLLGIIVGGGPLKDKIVRVYPKYFLSFQWLHCYLHEHSRPIFVPTWSIVSMVIIFINITEICCLDVKLQSRVRIRIMVFNGTTIFQLYRGGKFYWWRKLEYPEKTTDLSQSIIQFTCKFCIYNIKNKKKFEEKNGYYNKILTFFHAFQF